ncbi:hypothetical protein ATB97_12295 [Elizabethkingia bruuniana]|nr:hypothetical protein AYC65_12950 [Elizabethkingia bruuniana]KGO11037.1 hypothetical protein KS04_05925 [Elizabethkingia miricola]KUY22957.1 hypothetical protein ATB97_12295 [Elizabethkingia bruuniana]OPB68597.1 hypothetical protein BAY12_00135 [Elizabethkingia bruuniana]
MYFLPLNKNMRTFKTTWSFIIRKDSSLGMHRLKSKTFCCCSGNLFPYVTFVEYPIVSMW